MMLSSNLHVEQSKFEKNTLKIVYLLPEEAEKQVIKPNFSPVVWRALSGFGEQGYSSKHFSKFSVTART